ncbi:MAG: hypothetical protein M3O70_07545 [Actinomycetota bacterium]|nr:hypothetical protein [Actinomycetota bacterium]
MPRFASLAADRATPLDGELGTLALVVDDKPTALHPAATGTSRNTMRPRHGLW